jgi:NAD(P)H-nitrite reductase large subunit
MRRLLIAGAGKAALACIEQLAKLKHQFSISVLRGPAGPEPNGSAGPATGASDASPDWLGASPEWEQRLAKLGVEVHETVCVEAIDRYAKVVRGCDGSRTTFDTLILAAGSANPALARAARLEVRNGVLSNDYLQTSDAHVYALGEGAEHRGSVYTDAETIEEQARVLAAHIAGFYPSPFQGRMKSLAAGLPTSLPGIRSLAANLSGGAVAVGVSAIGASAIRTCDALSAVSVGSAPRSEDQKPAPEDQPALVGAA